MVFSSYLFLLGFLPLVLLVAGLLSRGPGRYSLPIRFLVLASLVYFGWWDPRYLILLGGSILFNFHLGRYLAASAFAATGPAGRSWLALGIAANLLALGYFKYCGFFLEVVSSVSPMEITSPDIALPLAISFFTFQQIAFLTDSARGGVSPHTFTEYSLFVCFFPQLIAGPIVHHAEVLPQIRKNRSASGLDIREGLVLFLLGLGKKILIADTLAPHADRVFDHAALGVGTLDAWVGTLAYTGQLYFDFSGYSDMALGLGLLFGIRLPVNFNSPYKAVDIIDFWRRWHITLSRFLRDYLYIPLGGNRRGRPRRYVNLMITMILGGLWHGAGWTFVFFGILHGLYLCVNHAWRALRGGGRDHESPWGEWSARLLTFAAVAVGFVFFRAGSFGEAIRVLQGLVGVGDFQNSSSGILGVAAAFLCLSAMVLPNSNETANWVREKSAADGPRAIWASYGIPVGLAALLVASLMFVSRGQVFLYYQF
ncbi:MBOAT family O-acyltransferase [Gemmatimonadota bacterium]